jgi:hypothetical protein
VSLSGFGVSNVVNSMNSGRCDGVGYRIKNEIARIRARYREKGA